MGQRVDRSHRIAREAYLLDYLAPVAQAYDAYSLTKREAAAHRKASLAAKHQAERDSHRYGE